MAETAQAEHELGLRHWLGFALLCATWSTTWMAIRVLVREVPPFRAAALRFAIAAAVLLVVAVVRKSRWPQSADEWRTVVVLGVTMMTIPFGTVFWAEQYITSGMTAVLSATTPLAIALLTPVMLHQKVPRRAVIALVVGFAGIAVLFWSGVGFEGRALVGGVMVLVSAFATAWSANYAKRHAQGISPVVNTGVQLALGTVLLGALSLMVERGQPSHWSGKAVGALFFLAVMGSSVAFAVYYWLLKRMRPYQAGSTAFLVPIGAMVEGAVLLGEPVTAVMVVATLVVVGAVAAVLRS
ncbi:MAG TPA: EamA family transporter [Terriglobales bacterium]|nr:EamA family transporter [Terriglobales bacterium]